MSPGLEMVRRAVEKIEPRRPTEQPPRAVPRHPPANDNRAPGLIPALLYIGTALVVLAALAWWLFV